MTVPQLSCIVPTYDRPALVARLLEDFAAQTLPPDRFEVLVVDDGSRPPVAPALRGLQLPFRFEVIEQPNGGPAAARHQGALRAAGEVLVFVDDDMIVPPAFLAEHWKQHQGRRAAVLGRIERDRRLGRGPLFERYRHHIMDTWYARAANGTRLRGTNICTGNLSMRRTDYLAVGGFDPELRVSEDAELGLRLEAAGVELVFSNDASTLHAGDHADEHWLQKARMYPVFDLAVARKHPRTAHADPWRYLFTWRAPLFAGSLLFPGVAHAGALQSGVVATAYTMEYCSGMREACGSLPGVVRSFVEYLRKTGT